MAGHDSTTLDSTGDDNEVDEVIAVYLQQVDAGQTPDQEAFLHQHAHLATELREFFDDLDRFTEGPLDPPENGSVEPANDNSPTPDSELPKLRYFGEYELVREIARGGMGVVYEAKQKSLKRTVAVKMILGGVLASEEDVRRFRTEAQAAAGLQHPGIVAIHEVGVCQDQHYFSMDLVSGSDLAELLKDGSLHHDQAIEYVQKVAQAVHYAHTQGTLHRDLKPSNILIDAAGEPRITDFGLAKLVHEDSDLTATGARLGTPSYMPPEQAAGESESVGPAGDIYSLGCILYELLTGRPPFRGSSVIQTLNMVVNQLPVSPRALNSEIPRDLANICLKCIQKLPADRYASAEALAEDLTRFVDGQPVSARPIGPIEKGRRWIWKQRKLIATSAAIIAIAYTGLFAWQKYSTYKDDLKSTISFITSGESLVTVIRNDLDRKLLPDFTTPTATPISLEAGDIRVLASKPHQLSEEFRLHTKEKRPATVQVEIEDRSIFPPLVTPTRPYIVTLADHADIIVADKESIERFDGATSKSIWKIDPTTDAILNQASVDWVNWIGFTPRDRIDRHSLLEAAPDLNGDGTGDLVWLSGNSRGTRNEPPAGLIAQSGVDGRILWVHRLSIPASTNSESFRLRIVGQPCVEFIDDDAIPDLIVTSTGEVRQVEVVSGKDGRLIWSHPIEPSQYQGPFRWTPDSRKFDTEAKCLNATCNNIRGQPVVIVSSGRQILCLDAQDGAELDVLFSKDWPIDEMTSADLNADGAQDILIRHQSETAQATFTAIDVTASTDLWQYQAGEMAANSSALAVDNVDNDGPAEVILSSTESIGPRGLGNRRSVCTMLNGSTGEVVWSSNPISIGSRDSGIELQRISDLNRDGINDFVAAQTKWLSNANMLYKGETLLGVHGVMIAVRALSGRDGKTLWTHSDFDKHRSTHTRLQSIREWTVGADGRPQIVLSMTTEHHSGQIRSSTLILNGGGSHNANGGQVIRDAEEVKLADFNGDGHLDVYWRDPPGSEGRNRQTTLHTIAGGSPVKWRRLGFWIPCSDLNGDGIVDLIDASPHNQAHGLTAISGLKGHILWHNRSQYGAPFPLQLPHGDIDGDGGPDIIMKSTNRRNVILEVVSGKTGESIWRREVPLRPDGPFGSNSNRLRFGDPATLDVDSDGLIDIVLLTHGRDSPEVIVIEAESGAIKWHTPPRSDKGNQGRIWIANRKHFRTNDASELLVVRHEEKKITLEALDGHTGKELWKRVPTVHELPLIEINKTPTQTVEDLPYPWTEWRSEPVSIALGGDAQPLTCFAQKRKLVIIDQSDRPRGAISIPDRLVTNSTLKPQLFSIDTDGDGSDELITATWIDQEVTGFPSTLKKTVVAVKLTQSGDKISGQPMWEWKMPSGFGDIIGVGLTPKGKPHITARSGSTVFSIDARTGKTRWTCDGPRWWTQDEQARQALGTYQDRRPVILQHETLERPASVLFRRYTDGGHPYAVDCRIPIANN
jgi:serine/threonine protein kinase/outer membrane protein assembly factor BamB